MKKELITEEELRALLREQGVEDFTQVRRCYLEGDGRLSVIPEQGRKPDRRRF